jgi:hypothetical protein
MKLVPLVLFLCAYMQTIYTNFLFFSYMFSFYACFTKKSISDSIGSSISKPISVHYQVCKTQAVKVSNQMSHGFGASEKPVHISKEKYDRPM